MNELSDNYKSDLDCAVCLQKCNHPTQLPCSHVFCFLCVKGIAFQSKKCAMCRAVIPSNYLDNPILLGTLCEEQGNTNSTQEVYQWFYEGRNGWWKYDERSNSELEAAYSSGEADCTLLLAGTLYNIDFQSMTQVRRSDQTRRRRVRRDTPMFPAKGIAGIKTDDTTTRQTKSDDEDDVILVPTENEVIEISDEENEMPIEPVSEPHEHVNNLIDSIR
ncbi:E3 ubiquitin-protein ligase rnf146 isoform X2 [Trichoplusia ni]|uniref:E3 ubiquitin-protein ligase n=1 Tax=Trichoplusia ni TaxID=7111 RepID=A0A7E5VQR1_TRINI|nr:E3 ubiquitin-protein ligase rnf146 isoform X2 [Trichoplusia ni]